MHEAARGFFRDQLAGLPALDVVEFGAADWNGSVRDVYPQARSWCGVDLLPGPGVDVVADAATWTTDRRFQVAVCAEVFEHTPSWPQIIATAHSVLEPGGLLVLSCATGGRPAHGADGGPLPDGEWYRNVSPQELWDALEGGWSECRVAVADGVFGQDDLYARARKV